MEPLQHLLQFILEFLHHLVQQSHFLHSMPENYRGLCPQTQETQVQRATRAAPSPKSKHACTRSSPPIAVTHSEISSDASGNEDAAPFTKTQTARRTYQGLSFAGKHNNTNCHTSQTTQCSFNSYIQIVTLSNSYICRFLS